MKIFTIAALGVALSGCAAINVHETTLSSNQKVAIVSSPGDGVSPPSSTVLLQGDRGEFVPVSTGYAQAPITAAVSGATAGIAIGAGNYAAARVLRPTQINQVQSGGTVTGATSTSQGASANASGGTGLGGSNTNSNFASGGSGGSGGSSFSTSSGGSSTAFGGSSTAFGGSGGSSTAFGGSGGTAFGGAGGTGIGGTAIGGSGGSSINTNSNTNIR